MGSSSLGRKTTIEEKQYLSFDLSKLGLDDGPVNSWTTLRLSAVEIGLALTTIIILATHAAQIANFSCALSSLGSP